MYQPLPGADLDDRHVVPQPEELERLARVAVHVALLLLLGALRAGERLASFASTDPFTSAPLVAAVEGGGVLLPPPHARGVSAASVSAERQTIRCMARPPPSL